MRMAKKSSLAPCLAAALLFLTGCEGETPNSADQPQQCIRNVLQETASTRGGGALTPKSPRRATRNSTTSKKKNSSFDPQRDETALTQVTPEGPILPRSLMKALNPRGHGQHQFTYETSIRGSEQTQLQQKNLVKRQARSDYGRYPLELVHGSPGADSEIDDESSDEDLSTCTAEHLASLTPAELITFIGEHEYRDSPSSCLYGPYWFFTPHHSRLLKRENLDAVVSEIARLAPTYDGTNRQNILGLILFVDIFYMHAANQGDHQVSGFPAAEMHLSVANAFKRLGDNPALYDKSSDAAILAYLISTMWNMQVADDAYGYFYRIIKQTILTFSKDPNLVTRLNGPSQGSALWQALNAFFGAQKSQRFLSQIDQAAMNELRRLSLDQALAQDHGTINAAAIVAVGTVFNSSEVAWQDFSWSILSEVFLTYEPFSSQWLWAVYELTIERPCRPLHGDGPTICKDVLFEQLKQHAFPNHFVFDDGAIVVDTPLPIDDVQVLYHAAKQVEAQFQRVTETVAPLEDDFNSTLHIKLFGSRQDYENFAPFLYGLPTANGGIYIEQDGAFYTYQRTKAESVFTLEELFRHEYAHYLIGRFLVKGLWGAAPIYKNDRMPWFDEGFAEFLQGSTADQGVLPLRPRFERSLDGGIDLLDIFAGYQQSFRFYDAAAGFFNYLYSRDKALLRGFVSAAAESDLKKFDQLVCQTLNNNLINSDYRSYMADVLRSGLILDGVSTAVPKLDQLDTRDVQGLFEQIHSTRSGAAVSDCSLSALFKNQRFSCRGTLTTPAFKSSGVAADAVYAWNVMNSGLDELIRETGEAGFSNNLKFLVCRFGNSRILPLQRDSSLSFGVADFYCDGPLPDASPDLTVQSEWVQSDFNKTRLGSFAKCHEVPGTPDVSCSAILEGYPIPAAIASDAILDANLMGHLRELRNQVYGMRPSYYHSLSCDIDWSTVDTRTYPDQRMSKYGNVNCQIKR